MHQSPLVSIIIPVYNIENYIEESIDSIINQSYKNTEIIIIDDGSTDDTLKVLNSYQDERIILLENGQNLGIAQSLNRGIEIAKGKYIARHDGDDISAKDRLSIQVEFLEAHQEVLVVGADMISWNGREDLGDISLPNNNLMLLLNTICAHPTTMYRTEFVKKNRITYEGVAEDFRFFNEVFFKNNFHPRTIVNLRKPLVRYRRHSTQYTLNTDVLSDVLSFQEVSINRYLSSINKSLSFSCTKSRRLKDLAVLDSRYSNAQHQELSNGIYYYSIFYHNESKVLQFLYKVKRKLKSFI